MAREPERRSGRERRYDDEIGYEGERKYYKRPWSVWAILGFILSFFGLLSILGIIFSAIGLSDTANHLRRGRGLAIAGLIIGVIVFLSSVFAFLGLIFAIPFLQFDKTGNIRETDVGGQTQVTVSGLNYQANLDYGNPIIIRIDGINNNITVSKSTEVISATLSGIGNRLYLCQGSNPPVQNSGINNEVLSFQC
jgi:hypothetical protein